MDDPSDVCNSACSTLGGRLVKPVLARGFVEGATGGLVLLVSSVELQLEAPNNATSVRTTKLETTRRGVQNFLVTCCSVIPCFVYFFLPNLNESRITGASPLTPRSSTDESSVAKDVDNMVNVAPVVSPSFPVGKKITRPHN